ncbi:unnamed protein product [Pleuronectes platessa]|uniref:Uncharacterized protein n=1 Tax=Pleuronectes platessa TaxID=8262 RepID=A0A9N7U8S4_PLEPL|nr:unnamed protein product [Pleuronectes platessa]
MDPSSQAGFKLFLPVSSLSALLPSPTLTMSNLLCGRRLMEFRCWSPSQLSHDQSSTRPVSHQGSAEAWLYDSSDSRKSEIFTRKEQMYNRVNLEQESEVLKMEKEEEEDEEEGG